MNFRAFRTQPRGAVGAILAALLWLSGCGAHVYHVVEPGETVYSVGWIYGYDYKEIAQWNGLEPPYRVAAGQRLRVAPYTPSDPVPKKPAAKPKTTKPAVAASRAPLPETTVRPAATKPLPPAVVVPVIPPPVTPKGEEAKRDDSHIANEQDTVIAWKWPTQGEVVRPFESGSTQKKGIAIGGAEGQPVYSSAPGRVVYSGSGLVGYGKLIIISHSKHFLSAYGHNSELLAREGDEIKQGQMIARMGRTGTDRAMLHFEMRRDGKPVDPLRYLPKVAQ